jgi:hypothetical protein
MPALFALAASVGVLAVVATWVFFLEPLKMAELQVWIGFIAWGCHYHCGGKITGTRNTILCMSFGAVVGWAAVLLAGRLDGQLGQFAAPIAVGIGATVIVLASKIPLFPAIPASVYGFASIAGLILLGGHANDPTAALLPTVLSVIIGALFGIVSEIVANALTKKSVLSPAKAT